MRSLYLMQPGQWFNDALIRAFCEGLELVYQHIRFAGIVSAFTKTTDNKDQVVLPHETIAAITQLASTSGVKKILLVVNFKNIHWTCIIVDVPGKKITIYDSCNSRLYLRTLESLTSILKNGGATSVQGRIGKAKANANTRRNASVETTATRSSPPFFDDYTVHRLDKPVQQDGYSCGFFVCVKPWGGAEQGIWTDMSIAGQNRGRVMMLQFILTGVVVDVVNGSE